MPVNFVYSGNKDGSFTRNSESNNTSPNATPTTVTDHLHTISGVGGARAIRCHPAAAAGLGYFNRAGYAANGAILGTAAGLGNNGANTSQYLRVYVYFRGTLPAEESWFGVLSASTVIFDVRVTSTGAIKVFDKANPTRNQIGVTSSAGLIIPDTAYQKVEFQVTGINLAAASWSIKIDGVTACSGSASYDLHTPSVYPVDSFYFGKWQNLNGGDVDTTWMDGLGSNTGAPGDGVLLPKLPASVGSYAPSGFNTVVGTAGTQIASIKQVGTGAGFDPYKVADYIRTTASIEEFSWKTDANSVSGITGMINAVLLEARVFTTGGGIKLGATWYNGATFDGPTYTTGTPLSANAVMGLILTSDPAAAHNAWNKTTLDSSNLEFLIGSTTTAQARLYDGVVWVDCDPSIVVDIPSAPTISSPAANAHVAAGSTNVVHSVPTSPNADRFRLRLGTDDATRVTFGPTDTGGTHAITLPGSVAGTVDVIGVAAGDTAGYSNYTTVSVTAYTAPAAPTDLGGILEGAIVDASATIVLSWTGSTGATKYRVRVDAGSWSADITDPTVTKSITTPSAGTHTWEVQAMGDTVAGWSASALINFTTEAGTSVSGLNLNTLANALVAAMRTSGGFLNTADRDLISASVKAVTIPGTALNTDSSGYVCIGSTGAGAITENSFVAGTLASIDDINAAGGEAAALPQGAVLTEVTNTASRFRTDRLEDADNYWRNCYIQFTAGNLSGQLKKVTGFTADVAGGFMLTQAYTETPTAGDTFVIVNR